MTPDFLLPFSDMIRKLPDRRDLTVQVLIFESGGVQMSEPTRLKRIVIKEEFVALTGEYIDAVILNQFIYWSERVRDFDKFIDEERSMAAHNGSEPSLKRTNGWIYKSCEELADEIMIKLSPSNMRNHLKKLVKNGWLDERQNPYVNFDRKKQYRVNLVKIHADLVKIGYTLQGYRVDTSVFASENAFFETENASFIIENGASDTKNPFFEIENAVSETESRTAQNRKAIPEITTEINTENIPEIIPEKSREYPSVGPSAGTGKKAGSRNMTDMDGYFSVIKNCGLELLPSGASTAVEEAVKELYYNADFAEKTLSLPQALVRESLEKLDHKAVELALSKMGAAAKSGKITNSKRYLMVCLFNCITEAVTDRISTMTFPQNGPGGIPPTIWDIVGYTELREPIEKLRERISEISFNTWFRNSICGLGIQGSVLKITARSEFCGDQLRSKYEGLLLEVFSDLGVREIMISSEETMGKGDSA